LTPADIRDVAANAGFAGADLDTAVAVSLAESHGDPSAYNSESQKGTPPGQGSYGLWQIYLWKHPEFAGINLMDPQENARVAYQLYSQHGFTPWATFLSGKYRAFLSPVPAPASYVEPPPLVLDASTGLPIDDSGIAAGAGYTYSPQITTSEPAFGTVLLWGAVGLFALWIFSESV
jgi:Lysozyme like domain